MEDGSIKLVGTCTLENGSITRMRFCSSRLSYSLARWVLIIGSSLSSALYSLRAWTCTNMTLRKVVLQETLQKPDYVQVRKSSCEYLCAAKYISCKKDKMFSNGISATVLAFLPFRSLLMTGSYSPGQHISARLSEQIQDKIISVLFYRHNQMNRNDC